MRIGIGDPGTGAENKLEEESGKRTLWIDYSEFIEYVLWALPSFGLQQNTPMANGLREMLAAVKLREEDQKTPQTQIPIILDNDTVKVTLKHWIEILVSARSFATQAIDMLEERGVIDLPQGRYEFSQEFIKRWKRHVFWKPREAVAHA